MFNVTQYRLYPTEDQKVLLAKHFGCARWVYNYGLEAKKEAWEERKEFVSRYNLSARIPVLRKDPETKWLSEVNAQSLQASLINLERAYVGFFREKKGHPKFKSKFGRQSFQVPQCGEVGTDFVKVPKLKEISAIVHRPVIGKIKTITISQAPTGKYFAAVLSETDEVPPEKVPITEGGTVGIDLGLKHFAVLSTGEKVANPQHLKRHSRRLKAQQRRLSRRKKDSNRRSKQRLVVARVHERISNSRKDFLHKLTSKLVRDNQTDTFALEDLVVSNMVKNHHLASAISDVGWAEFRRQLVYKAEKVGKNIVIVGRFEPSSKKCSGCGKVKDSLSLSERVWTCTCGAVHDRDLNAARNIKMYATHPQNLLPRVTRESTLGETYGSH